MLIRYPKLMVVAAGVLLAAGVGARAVISALPASRLAREVVVYRARVEAARLDAAGRHEVALPVAREPGPPESLEIEITRKESAPPVECREVEPAEVARLAAEGRSEKVQFVDTVRAEVPAGPAMPSGGFLTAAGVLCVPSAGAQVSAEQRAPGRKVRAWGTTSGTTGGAPLVLVDGVRPEPFRTKDEPPWQVTARWGGQQVLSVSTPGDYPLLLARVNPPGGRELVGVRLRQFRVADIEVDGHPVAAELATTPQARSYGLQGRAGLGTDKGMLFCFPEPLVPVFVMKTVSFPLAIAFIQADGTIANIEWLNPGDERQAAAVLPVSYVLEMEQGWFRAHGATPGKKVSIP